MELRELKEKIETLKGGTEYYFNCFGIKCVDCTFNNLLDNSCGGMMVNYNWEKIKELDLPNNTVVTKELLKEFKRD